MTDDLAFSDLLATEAIVFVFSIYAAFIWGILYLALEAVGIIFTEFNFSQGSSFP